MRAAVDAVVAEFGRLDIVVNNAGIGAQGTVADNADDEWLRVLDINLLGMVRVSRAALPHLRRSPAAAIVNTGSIAATAGLPQRALYSATKGAVHALTRAMAADHLREGIRVNCVSPGTADTPWIGRLLAKAADPAAERARAGRASAARPAGRPRRGRRRDRLPRQPGIRLDDRRRARGRRRHAEPQTATGLTEPPKRWTEIPAPIQRGGQPGDTVRKPSSAACGQHPLIVGAHEIDIEQGTRMRGGSHRDCAGSTGRCGVRCSRLVR